MIAPTALPNETTAAPADTLIPALARLFLVMFALEPILHCTNGGGELVEELRAEDSVDIMSAPTAAPTETTAAPAETLIPALARLFLVRFALEPILHCMNGGGRRPGARGFPASRARAGADPAWHERRRQTSWCSWASC
jgi:hypothetical protein